MIFGYWTTGKNWFHSAYRMAYICSSIWLEVILKQHRLKVSLDVTCEETILLISLGSMHKVVLSDFCPTTVTVPANKHQMTEEQECDGS